MECGRSSTLVAVTVDSFGRSWTPTPSIERAVLFDQSQASKEARPLLAGADDKGRLELVGGDFFTTVPAGADVDVMKMILHDWTRRGMRDDPAELPTRNRTRAAGCWPPRSSSDPTSGDWFPYFLDLRNSRLASPAANAPRRSSISSTAQPDSD